MVLAGPFLIRSFVLAPSIADVSEAKDRPAVAHSCSDTADHTSNNPDGERHCPSAQKKPHTMEAVVETAATEADQAAAAVAEAQAQAEAAAAAAGTVWFWLP